MGLEKLTILRILPPNCTKFAHFVPSIKPKCVGGWRWAMPPTPEFCVGDTNMLILEPTQTLKFASSPTQNLKFALALTQNPNASQWNIGCVGHQMQNFCVGHVHFMFIVLCPAQSQFPVEYGLKESSIDVESLSSV